MNPKWETPLGPILQPKHEAPEQLRHQGAPWRGVTTATGEHLSLWDHGQAGDGGSRTTRGGHRQGGRQGQAPAPLGQREGGGATGGRGNTQRRAAARPYRSSSADSESREVLTGPRGRSQGDSPFPTGEMPVSKHPPTHTNAHPHAPIHTHPHTHTHKHNGCQVYQMRQNIFARMCAHLQREWGSDGRGF